MKNGDEPQSFRILSIDGGGIRGIIPARFLCDLESDVSHDKGEAVRLCDYFDLICGTSTGGIIAIGLALGMSAAEVLNLYKNNASTIFGQSSWWLGFSKNVRRLAYPKHSSLGLTTVLKAEFARFSENGDTRIGHARTRLAIPAFLASEGKPRVFKTSHDMELKRDYQIPAYQVALSTSAAPTYFSAHTFEYEDNRTKSNNKLTNLIDGGVFANNPALIGISEALALGFPVSSIKLLSLGTGSESFKEPHPKNRFYNLKPAWGVSYWLNPFAGAPLIEMMMQANSESIDNTVKILSRGLGRAERSVFQYDRVQVRFESKKERVGLDSSRKKELEFLEAKGKHLYDLHGGPLTRSYFDQKITPYTPSFSL